MNSLSNIAFEQISGNYHWGQYGDFKVIIDITNGYINATHLCGLSSSISGVKREFRMWKRLDTATNLINAVSSSVQICTDKLLIIPIDLSNDLRGTYAHPKLIPHIASWVSAEFAVKVSDIVNAHLVREYQDSIRVKDQTIDRLEAKVDEQTRKIEQLLATTQAIQDENAVITAQLDNVTDELDVAALTNDDLNDRVADIAVKLNVATDQRVPPARRNRLNEVFAIYRNPQNNKFFTIRRQQRTFDHGVSNCRIKGYTERFYYCDSPNAVNLYTRIKDIIPSHLAQVRGNVITLNHDKTPDDLTQAIVRAEREKKNI
jgi:uncharacterized protein YoxC